MSTYIKGAGMTKFGYAQRGSYEDVFDSTQEALDMAEMDFDQIDAIFISNSEQDSNDECQRHTAPMLSSLFQKKLPIVTVPAACAGGGAALWNAIKYQRSTGKNNILVIGFEKLVASSSQKVTDEIFRAAERVYEQSEGMVFPAQNALVAQQYMMKYNATEDDLALVALKNHENAYHNEKAVFYNKSVSIDQIKESPVVASPLRLFDCSIPVNGSAAVIISTDKTDIEIAGTALHTCNLGSFEREDMTTWNASVGAAREAYTQANISAPQLDIVEIHDAFTSVELISYEDIGLAGKGRGMHLIRDGSTKLNGKLPVNTSGGLKAKGHPISATGVSQIYELVKQMRKEAGKRQVDGIKNALAHNIGGAGSLVACHVLKKAA